MTGGFDPPRRLHLRKRCATSGKRKYRDQVDVHLDNVDNPDRLRAYLCPDCGFWHATRRAADA